MTTLTITGSQLKIETTDHETVETLHTWIEKRLATYTFPRGRARTVEIDAIYAVINRDSIYLHSNTFIDATTALDTMGLPYKVVRVNPPEPRMVDIQLQAHITPRDYQVKGVNHLMETDTPTKLLGFLPGAGKTISFLYYASKVKHVCCAVMKPNYAEQWVGVIPTVTNLTDEDILHINSASGLIKAQQQHLDGIPFTCKMIVISNSTMRSYLSKWTEGKYLMSPSDFMTALGVGTLLIDEVHEDLHFNYLLCANIHVQKVIGLSGTFISRDPKITKLQEYMFPQSDRYDLLASEPYISYIEATYHFPLGIEPSTTVRGGHAYAHIEYERWLLRRPNYLRQFLARLVVLANTSYVKRRIPGQKLLIYAMRNEMAHVIREAFELAVPELTIACYVEDSPYSTLLDSDIIITSPIKAGAAVDIPGLIVVMSTYLTASIQRLIQMLGRLRRIDDVEVIYIQLLCGNIPKHLNYQSMNRDVVEGRVARYETMCLPGFSRH